ncbi:UNVERIFIED_CONTAM: hypothetical protein K2H54_012828 [Gekko kuhli]
MALILEKSAQPVLKLILMLRNPHEQVMTANWIVRIQRACLWVSDIGNIQQERDVLFQPHFVLEEKTTYPGSLQQLADSAGCENCIAVLSKRDIDYRTRY